MDAQTGDANVPVPYLEVVWELGQRGERAGRPMKPLDIFPALSPTGCSTKRPLAGEGRESFA